jgi:HK97 family phage prohead protease
MSNELETRTFEIEFRDDAEEGIFEGIAVPWNQTVNIGGRFNERFERGSIDPSERVSIYRDHKTLIGHVVEAEDREEGLWIRARVALSDLGRDTLALLRSGALNKLSVGFVPVTDRRDGDVTVRSRVSLREVSVVERPAYSLANILAVREDTTPIKETNMSDADTSTDFTEFRGAIEDLDRKIEVLSNRNVETHEVEDTRSAAEVIKAIAAGDAETIRSVNDIQERAYTGSTTADNGSTLKPAYVADLTRIFDASSGVLNSVFSSGTLPESGMSLEFSELNTNTHVVAEQLAEGDDLAFGKVTLTSRTTPIRTFGGYTQLTIQEIKRSTLPILQRNLEAQAVAAGASLKAQIRGAFNTLVTSRTGLAANAGVVVLGATLAASTYNNFVNAIVDAAIKYSQNNLSVETLVVSASVFKKMASLNGSDGRPMLTLDGTGVNTVGRLNVTALNGSLLGIPVVLDPDQTGDSAVFIDSRALRVYASGVVNLQDQNIINLSNTFSVYRFGAFAPEIPAGLVPLKLSA